MEYKIIDKKEYHKNKDLYLNMIYKMYENDDNKLANIEDTEKHLDFIFNLNYNFKSLLILLIKNNELISMVNAYEYDNKMHNWCLFLLFTKKSYRKKGYSKKILNHLIDSVKKYNGFQILSGIEKDNIISIKIHEQLGFKYADCNWDDIDKNFPKNHLAYMFNIEK